MRDTSKYLVVSYWAEKRPKKGKKTLDSCSFQALFLTLRKTDLDCTLLLPNFQVACNFWRNAYARLPDNRIVRGPPLHYHALTLGQPSDSSRGARCAQHNFQPSKKITVLTGFVRAKIGPKKQNRPPISHVKPRTVLYTVSCYERSITSVIDAKVDQQRSYIRIARVQKSTHRDCKPRVNRRIQEHPIKL